MTRLRRGLVTLAGAIGVLGASIAPATASTQAVPAAADPHACKFIIIYANCPSADPDWYWICITNSNTIEYYNDCDIFLTRD